MQEVLLVEVVDLDSAAVVHGSAELADRGPARDRVVRALRRRWPVAAGLVVLLLVGAVAAGVRARDRVARLAAQPGVLAPLDPSLHEVWREPMRGWGQLITVGGDILLFGPDEHQAAAVVSFDGITGRQKWSAPLPEMPGRGDVRCVALGGARPADAARVACRVLPVSSVGADEGPAGPATLVVLDASTGRRVAQHRLDSVNVSIVPFGSDLVLTEVGADGHATVQRADPITGQVRWTFRSAQPLRSPSGPFWFDPSVQHGVIVANGPVTWAFAPDGKVLGEWHLQGGDWSVTGGWGLNVTVLPDGRFAVGESGGVGLTDADYGTVSTTAARDGFRIPGPVLSPSVDDGSAPGILFTVPTGHLGAIAFDFGTGKRMWESNWAHVGGALVLDGRLIAMTGGRLLAVDARSGRQLWSVEVPRGNYGEQLFTDGRVVVVPMYDPDRGAVLTAFAAADGREQWMASLPAGTNHFEVSNHRLVALTDQDLVALG